MRTALLLACLSVFVLSCGDAVPPRAGPPPAGLDLSKSVLLQEGSITPYRFELRRTSGEMVPGVAFTLDIAIGRDDDAPKPASVRVWAGASDAANPAKIAAVPMDGERGEYWRATVELPASQPTPVRISVETESAVGRRTVTVPLR